MLGTTYASSGFFGALINSYVNSAVNTLSFYNGSTLLDTINLSGLGAYIPNGGSPLYSAYLNVDFLGRAGYTSVVFTGTGGAVFDGNGIYAGLISTSLSPVSLTSLTSGQAPSPTPLPALGGTAMGLLALVGGALRSLIGRRHRAL
jgi:hypothetical protein